MSIASDGLELIDPQSYAANGYPHALWGQLRREAPVKRFHPPGFCPFWAVTKHADICSISKQPHLFRNQAGPMLMTEEQKRGQEERGEQGFHGMRTVIETDPPVHRALRKVASPWFTPRALGRVDEMVERSARELVDELAARGPDAECDFVTDVAARHPLRILSQILGVPREDEPFILRVTNELFGGEDPEFQREAESEEQRFMALGLEMYEYFSKKIAETRANPDGNLASVLANGKIDGEPLSDMDTLGYYLITFTAGHETTRNALTGGVLALIQNPDQFEKLKANPDLVPSAVEEIVRWSTPVNYMKRLVAEDVEVRGVPMRRGDELVMFYASANRDEDVFDDPFSFRIDRNPNRHLGFGIGEHFCLGAHLARRSQAALFRELARRVEAWELAGEPERVASSFVAGVKHLPIRYRME